MEYKVKTMENLIKDYSHIKGWGVDADPKNEPTYPMKNYTGDDHKRSNWERPPLQQQKVEMLRSIERPNLPAVFGTTSPPSGLSGNLRRYAFKYSESSYRHWLPLILADRINVLEGIVDDFKRGHIPNIFVEKGYKAEWKYNAVGFAKKVFMCALFTTAIVVVLSGKKK